MINFTGRWITSYGPMELRQNGGAIQGKYWYQGNPCTIAGTLEGDRFVFHYEDPTGAGHGWFEQSSYGQMRGEYHLDSGSQSGPWAGQREWDGVWDTTFGRLRLVQEEDRILGFYDGAGPARIEGRLEGDHFNFQYFEPKIQGEGSFELAEDAHSFEGSWRPQGASGWGEWQGRRVFPVPGLTWLVVIEAPWQRSLADVEYSYGVMLKEFFARLPHVAVRQRYFNDTPSLQRWCHDLMYLLEPAIVLISSHGLAEGVTVHGQTIDTKLVIDALRYANNIQLLHFATCLMLKEENAGDFARRIDTHVPYPISGYTTSIDWGGSAILEFNYFDMILGKGIPPAEAARLLPTLVTYSGDQAPPDSPYRAAGFRFFDASSESEV